MSGGPAGRLFGTDGLRARAGEPPLDRITVTALAKELALLLRERAVGVGGRSGGDGSDGGDGVDGSGGGVPRVVLGGDTRESTAEICSWLADGLADGGAEVCYAGVIPTPGVSFLAGRLGAAAGVVVSASHNPYPDNGIKLLDGGGHKFPDAFEHDLEIRLLANLGRPASVAPPTPVAPRMHEAPRTALIADAALQAAYLDHLAATLNGSRAAAAKEAEGHDGRPLAGLRVVLDAGNGAAAAYAGPLFERLGAAVEVLGDAPNGRNVNLSSGSTAPEAMAAATVESGAQLGAAFDGDADRCILADERGAVRDGDAILYLWATRLHAEGSLTPPAIVATSMSNLGLERALARDGIRVVRCGVGDRQVYEAMQRDGILLGGEQSGHIIHRGLAATGDGLLTALHMAALLHRAGRPLSELLAGFRRYPQILLNIRVVSKPDLATLPRVAAAACAVEDELGADGRLVLRYSGTEPLARVMIEGPDQSTVEALAHRLAAVIAEEIGAPEA